MSAQGRNTRGTGHAGVLAAPKHALRLLRHGRQHACVGVDDGGEELCIVESRARLVQNLDTYTRPIAMTMFIVTILARSKAPTRSQTHLQS